MAPTNYVTCQPVNGTTEQPDDIGKDDLNALLYIVATLLFYSMGIVIGIITYLKREQAEMEEDKMFDMYMQFKREPFTIYKKEKVNQMAMYLKELEEKRAAREKIDAWKTVDDLHQHHHHHPSCRHHPQHLCTHHSHPHSHHSRRHSPCPDCKKKSPLELRHSHGGGAPLAIPEGDWTEGGGGTALLCSLTLGVCEPLLTPDSVKRVAFPDSPIPDTQGTLGNQVKLGHILPPTCQCNTYRGTYRYSSPTVHYSQTSTQTDHHNNDQPTCNETNEPIIHAAAEQQATNGRITSYNNIELQDLGQSSCDQDQTVFHKDYAMDSRNSPCDTDLCHVPSNIPSPKTRSLSLADPPRQQSKLVRQFSHDPDRKATGLAVHAAARKSQDQTGETDSQGVFTRDDTETGGFEQSLLPLSLSATCGSFDDKPIVDDFNLCGVATANVCDEDDMQQRLLQKQQPCLLPQRVQTPEQQRQQQPFYPQPAQQQWPLQFEVGQNILQQQQQEQQQQQHELPPPIVASPLSQPTSPSSAVKFHVPIKHQPPRLSLQPQGKDLHQLQQQHLQQQQPTDVRPKASALTNIPMPSSDDEAVAASTSSSDYPLISDKRRRQDVFSSWKKNSQTVDIPDLARSRKSDPQRRREFPEKKGALRSQPERRGALFFTQKSLHHKDADSPKSMGGRLQYRLPGSFSRQESVDSAVSRNSDLSEGLESPLLQPDNDDSNNALNLSSASSSAGSSSMSPPSRHQRRIPRLARSQTIDTSKLLHK